MVDGIESLSMAWGGHSGQSTVKLARRSKSKSDDAVIGQMLELLMCIVGVVAVFVECLANALLLSIQQFLGSSFLHQMSQWSTS